jgi:hypothetical protein
MERLGCQDSPLKTETSNITGRRGDATVFLTHTFSTGSLMVECTRVKDLMAPTVGKLHLLEL